MTTSWFKKLRDVFSRDAQVDIKPPPPNIALKPKPIPPARDAEDRPRAGAPLKGKLVTKPGNTTVLIENEDATEELLSLDEDSVEKVKEEGFDPYNTDRFTTTGIWDSKPRR